MQTPETETENDNRPVTAGAKSVTFEDQLPSSKLSSLKGSRPISREDEQPLSENRIPKE